MAIEKSTGVTATERMLAELAERSFLNAWSYPNPIKDDGKELCDLLAVFENHVFIFFDRESRHFEKIDADPFVNWQRWKRSAIDAQILTAKGAERYIRSGRPIFLDTERTKPFLQLWVSDKGNYDTEYRPTRRALLEVAMGSAKNKFPELKTIVGIAIDAPKFSKENSEDFMLLDCTDWPPELEKQYADANQELNFFATPSLKIEKRRNTDFPVGEAYGKNRRDNRGKVDFDKRVRLDRGALCSCGSGREFRRCHGRR